MKNALFALFISLLPSSFLSSMEIQRVILGSDTNPLYIEFWPIIAPIWKKMGFQPTLALIAEEDYVIDESLGDVIRVNPLPDIPTSLQAQVIRLFLPALFPDDVCLISDMDMIPVSKSYFVDGAKPCPDDAFLVYRDLALPLYEQQFPMCYVAAKGSLFGSIFDIFSYEDILERIIESYYYRLGWTTDQRILYATLLAWEKQGGHLFRLGHEVGPRIDRLYWNHYFYNLDVTPYIDCHCPRPYHVYHQSIDLIVKKIYEQLEN